MGDKITIKNIELLSNGLLQVDIENETTKEVYRMFVSQEKLNDMIKFAKINRESKNINFNKIVNILNEKSKVYPMDECDIEVMANALCDHGVIVLPCDIGDKVYQPNFCGGAIDVYEITAFLYDSRAGLQFKVDDDDNSARSIDIIGDEVFLTEQEAIDCMNTSQ